jgi:hypothetical protein
MRIVCEGVSILETAGASRLRLLMI